MPGQPVKIGPFVGGMNTYSGPTSIADTEAVELLNVDIDLDGTVVSRPPLAATSTGVSGSGHIIGVYRSTTDIVYMIYAFAAEAKAFNTSDGVFTTIAAGDFTASVQYNDFLWLIKRPSGVTQGGTKWSPSAGASDIATMPRGLSACVYKERVFISASRTSDDTSINRVKFSNPADPATWTSTDYFDVSAGDGQDITKLIVFDAGIVIFKSDSTFLFAYESAPTKGQIQQISASLGANNNYCVVEYENNLFVMHEANVYRISNWNWEHANIKVPFEYVNSFAIDIPDGSSISVVDNRLICRYFDSYYVLGLKTGSWVKWVWATGRTPSEFVGSPTLNPATGTTKYYAASYATINVTRYEFENKVDAVAESFMVKILTKAYDFGPSYSFKRLFWWGVDILSKAPIDFRVTPVVYAVPVTWGQLIGVPFTSLGTWGRPLEVSIDVTDSINSSNPSNYRTFVKLLKSLRFRQIQFTLESTLDGTSQTGPLRVFSLTAFVDSRETVVKKVS